MSKHIAPYILRSEYRCKCCKKLPVDLFTEENEPEIGTPFLMLFKHFEDIRKAWGRPINISSGFRCPERNRAERGLAYSIHLFGLALDLDCNLDEVDKLAKLVKKTAPVLRVGAYKNHGSFVHIDLGYFIYPRIDEKWRKGARWHD